MTRDNGNERPALLSDKLFAHWVCFDALRPSQQLFSCDISDSFTIWGLWVLGLAVSHSNGSNCKTLSPEHYLSLHCILGLAEIKTLHPRDKIMRKRCRMRR